MVNWSSILNHNIIISYNIRDCYRIFGLGGGNNIYNYMLEYQMCIRYVIVLAILHVLFGIVLTNKLQK